MVRNQRGSLDFGPTILTVFVIGIVLGLGLMGAAQWIARHLSVGWH